MICWIVAYIYHSREVTKYEGYALLARLTDQEKAEEIVSKYKDGFSEHDIQEILVIESEEEDDHVAFLYDTGYSYFDHITFKGRIPEGYLDLYDCVDSDLDSDDSDIDEVIETEAKIPPISCATLSEIIDIYNPKERLFGAIYPLHIDRGRVCQLRDNMPEILSYQDDEYTYQEVLSEAVNNGYIVDGRHIGDTFYLIQTDNPTKWETKDGTTSGEGIQFMSGKAMIGKSLDDIFPEIDVYHFDQEGISVINKKIVASTIPELCGIKIERGCNILDRLYTKELVVYALQHQGYIMKKDGYLFCIDLPTQKLIWCQDEKGVIHTSDLENLRLQLRP